MAEITTKVIGEIKCQACEGKSELRESKTGGATYTCPKCGWQGMGRTPNATKAISSRIMVPAPTSPPSSPPAPSSTQATRKDPW